MAITYRHMAIKPHAMHNQPERDRTTAEQWASRGAPVARRPAALSRWPTARRPSGCGPSAGRRPWRPVAGCGAHGGNDERSATDRLRLSGSCLARGLAGQGPGAARSAECRCSATVSRSAPVAAYGCECTGNPSCAWWRMRWCASPFVLTYKAGQRRDVLSTPGGPFAMRPHAFRPPYAQANRRAIPARG